jgi:prevent-host-death family protein
VLNEKSYAVPGASQRVRVSKTGTLNRLSINLAVAIVAMRSYKKKLLVGIKELKDHASEIIALVQRTGQAVSITKNQQEVARIMPYQPTLASV